MIRCDCPGVNTDLDPFGSHDKTEAVPYAAFIACVDAKKCSERIEHLIELLDILNEINEERPEDECDYCGNPYVNETMHEALVCAMKIGYAQCKLETRAYEGDAADGRRQTRARQKGGKATARVTPEEKLLIIEARNKLAKEEKRSKLWAAGIIDTQLRTGTFPGIKRRIEYSPGYIADLHPER